jgi:hypothetical protein
MTMPPKLSTPLPRGIQIQRVVHDLGGGEPTCVLSVALPWGVVDLLAQTLELAARLTGSDKVGANVTAICLECSGEWSAQAAEAGHLEGWDKWNL